MEHPLKRLILALLAVGALVLAFVGVSAAVESDDTPPPTESTIPPPDCTADETDSTDATTDDTDDGDEACEDTTTDDTTTDTTDDTTDDTTTDTTTDDTPTDEGDPDAPESHAHPANHGAAVSEAAHACPPGPDHGPCVADVARSQAGKPHEDGGETNTGESDEASDDTDATAPPSKGKGARGNSRGR